jgi:AcrR family transcriptional regulator
MSGIPERRATGLERAIAGRKAPRPTPLDALRLARRRWFAGERLDMGALARALGVSRATLYSWVGSREQLLGEVVWSFAREGVRQARESAVGSGVDYVVDVVERFDRMNASFPPLRRFIEQDPELALRVLASKDGPVQARMIAACRDLLAEQVAAGALTPALDVDTLAYLMIRIAESFLYSDLITGSEPDVEKAVEAVRVLLHAPPLPPRRRTAPAKSPRPRRASGATPQARARSRARGESVRNSLPSSPTSTTSSTS